MMISCQQSFGKRLTRPFLSFIEVASGESISSLPLVNLIDL